MLFGSVSAVNVTVLRGIGVWVRSWEFDVGEFENGFGGMGGYGGYRERVG